MRPLPMSWGLLLCLAGVATAQSSDDLAAWAGDLTHVEPWVRADARGRLLLHHHLARPLLERMARGHQPAQAAAARSVLRRFPIDRPDDPQWVVRHLRNYSSGTREVRLGLVSELLDHGGDEQVELALRILRQDDQIEGWVLLPDLLENRTSVARTLADTPIENLPDPLLYARAYMPGVGTRLRNQMFLHLLRRPGGLSRHGESYYNVALSDAFLEAAPRQDWDRQLEIARLGVAKTNPAQGERWLARLLVVHARHGPLDGFESDYALLEQWRSAHDQPVSLPLGYAVAMLAQNPAAAFDRAGWPTLQTIGTRPVANPYDLLDVADFLLWVGRADLAGAELRRCIELSARQPGGELLRATARLWLAGLARDDQGYLQSMEAALDGLLEHFFLRERTPGGIDREVPVGMLRSQLWQRRLQVAMNAHNDAAVRAALDNLGRQTIRDPDVTIAVLQRTAGTPFEAAAEPIFESTRRTLQSLIDATRSADRLNSLAWLLARTGRDPALARELSIESLRLDPDNPAFLDTLAEAEFRLGNIDEAIRLQERALELDPGDEFMTEQLERFRAAREKSR